MVIAVPDIMSYLQSILRGLLCRWLCKESVTYKLKGLKNWFEKNGFI